MDAIEIDSVATPELTNPILVEGLPGIGLVGKLAVDHLVEEFDGRPVRRVYSEHLPPVVSVDDGVAELPCLITYAVETGERDLLVLTGDSQAQDATGHYRLAGAVLDVAAEFGVDEVVTLGGFGTGEQVDEYGVVGAVAEGSEDLKRRLADAGVEFDRKEAPNNIVGMSGLLVGLGARRGFETAGLLGVTSGYHVDPASARAVLDVLQEAFGFSVALDTLEEQAEQVQNVLERLRERQRSERSTGQGGENLWYFG